MTSSTTDNLKVGCECNIRVYNSTTANGLSEPWELFCRRETNGTVASQTHSAEWTVAFPFPLPTTSTRLGCNRCMVIFLILYYDTNYHTTTLYYQQLHLKYLCNLVRYWLQAPWGWHDSAETCRSVVICEIIVHLLVTVQNNKRCTVQVLKYWCNLARYWLQAVWGWQDSVETCSGVIICEVILHWLVKVKNNKRCTVQVFK